MFVGKEMLQRRQQERTKPALLAAEALQVIALKEAGKETLGEVFGVLLRVAVAADVGIEGIPVGAAQFLQRPFCLWRAAAASGQHDRPVRRGENVARCGRSGSRMP